MILNTPSIENTKQMTDQGVEQFIHWIVETMYMVIVSEWLSQSRKEDNESRAKFSAANHVQEQEVSRGLPRGFHGPGHYYLHNPLPPLKINT